MSHSPSERYPDGKAAGVLVALLTFLTVRAAERLFAKYPEYRKQVVFIQAGPDSRTHIPRYKELSEEIVGLAEAINWRHGSDDWMPILLLRQHLPLPQVLALYRLAEGCVVSALHDGWGPARGDQSARVASFSSFCLPASLLLPRKRLFSPRCCGGRGGMDSPCTLQG